MCVNRAAQAELCVCALPALLVEHEADSGHVLVVPLWNALARFSLSFPSPSPSSLSPALLDISLSPSSPSPAAPLVTPFPFPPTEVAAAIQLPPWASRCSGALSPAHAAHNMNQETTREGTQILPPSELAPTPACSGHSH